MKADKEWQKMPESDLLNARPESEVPGSRGSPTPRSKRPHSLLHQAMHGMCAL